MNKKHKYNKLHSIQEFEQNKEGRNKICMLFKRIKVGKSKRIEVLIIWMLISIVIVFFQSSCKKLVEIDSPITSITGANVFNNDATAAAVLTGIYTNMSQIAFADGGLTSMSLFPALSADELTLFSGSTNTAYVGYYTNALSNSNTRSSDFWSNIYPIIFVVNSAIEGLNNNSALTPAVDQQIMGEAKFMRALCYFYLVNLYGDVPLVTGTNYTTNAILSRTPKAHVWQQIISDLKDAQNLMSTNYLDATLLKITSQRVRPTSWAATALLARTYLYIDSFSNAEAQATAVINNSALYSLDTLNGVFLKNSMEAIWQLQPVNSGQNTQDAILFNLPASGPDNFNFPVYLSSFLMNAFEPNDQRRSSWVDSVTMNGTTYYYPYKYKALISPQQNNIYDPPIEYLMIFRLGEQFLIRSEARTHQGNNFGAKADLNAIRIRAGLDSTTANDMPSLLTAIMHERQVELFTEWGHRWLDLKRTASVDSVMRIVTPQKANGNLWQSYQQLYPVPLSEIKTDPNLVQNIGY